MKNICKIISIIIMISFVLSFFSLSVSAESNPVDNLRVTILTDKENYSLLEKAVITVSVENIGAETVLNVSAGVSGGDYRPVRGSITYCKANLLLPGESCSVSFSAILSPETQGLSFFKSLLLRLMGVFIKTDNFPLTGINNKYTVRDVTETIHGGVKASVSAYAVCGSALTRADESTALELLSLYNNAVIKTESKSDVAGKVRYKLNSINSSEDSLGRVLDTVLPSLEKTFDNTMYDYSGIPGDGLITPDDINDVFYTQNDGIISLLLCVNDQTEGFVESTESGPVSRAVGTVGSLDASLEELNAKIISGEDTLKIDYTDTYIFCVINEDDIIESGKWQYTLGMTFGNISVQVSNLQLNIRDVSASMDYIVEMQINK